MEMFQKQDAEHMKAMENVQKLMSEPEEMQKWFVKKKKEFDELG